ncbi:MAG TPA: hypothetical protein VK623_11230 [Flavobacterium sp.]|nr:hypothetical protein [Flavobacterium sp.]
MKTTKYLIVFFVLFTGLFSCKKETETQLTAPYETPVIDTIGVSDMNADSNSVSGSGISTSSSNSNRTGKKNSTSHSAQSTSNKSKNDGTVDMTKDTIMTPADKLGPSGTPGSGRGNTRSKNAGTGTGTNASQGSSTGK